MIVAWTGHRPEKIRNHNDVKDAIFRQLEYNNDDLECITGGARGVDMWVAGTAIALNIPCRIYLPFPFDVTTKGWKEWDKELLSDLLTFAKWKEVNKSYTKQGYQARNMKMVDDADQLVAVWNGVKRGGTWNTIKYAKSKNVPITILSSK